MKKLEKLKTKRLEKGITSEEMAKKLGISIHTYYSYEQSLREPNIERLKGIAEILECKVDDLI